MAIANYDHISRCFTLKDYPREAPVSQYEGMQSLWSAMKDGVITHEQAAAIAIPSHERQIRYAERWIAHLDNRLAYERAMLNESGGIAADRFNIVPGGRVLVREEWLLVGRVNRSNGAIVSITTNTGKCGIERVKDYREPSANDAALVSKATKLPPLCNYPGEGFLHMAKADYDRTVPKWSDFPKIATVKATETAIRHRVRQTRKPAGEYFETALVFLTDVKRTDPPKPEPEAEPLTFIRQYDDASKLASLERGIAARQANQPTKFDALKQQLKTGVKVVTAPQLFPTPPELARRMADEAGVTLAGKRVLEPSAGTGNLIRAAINSACGFDNGLYVVAVEINSALALGLEEQRRKTLYANERNFEVRCADFLALSSLSFPGEGLGWFDVVLMNPPFQNAEDIKHIQHAMQFVKRGGILVAICANGPRQNDILKPTVENQGGIWEVLPPETFKDSGTSVNTVLLTIPL